MIVFAISVSVENITIARISWSAQGKSVPESVRIDSITFIQLGEHVNKENDYVDNDLTVNPPREHNAWKYAKSMQSVCKKYAKCA